MPEQADVDVDRLWAMIEPIEGWFHRDEADVLVGLITYVLMSLPADVALVEVGSYHGRSTALISSMIRSLASATRATVLRPVTLWLPRPGSPSRCAILLDPNPAVTRAGLVEDLARRVDADKIDQRIAFLISDAEVQTPFARTLDGPARHATC